MHRNYQKELDAWLAHTYGDEAAAEAAVPSEKKQRLLLHCCCAPCSSYVTEYLHNFFSLTLLFYNPNITDETEYFKRKEELLRYLREVRYGKEISVIDADYDPETYLERIRGLEEEPERGKRCEVCFGLRLSRTAEEAVKSGFSLFCTTLSISPHKDADCLMRIGEELADRYGLTYLPSDFKKKNGYKRSIELSQAYHLYRQDYCGCVFSEKQKR